MRFFLLVLFISTTTGLAAEPFPGTQSEMRLELPDGRSIPYLLYLPKDYKPDERQWPLLLFLHGRGESYGPLSLVKKWGPPRRVDLGEQFPYVIASPQCPGEESWAQPNQQSLLVALLDHLIKERDVDTDRVYLTGLSMGGYGSWRLAADHPNRFAAVVPVCGGGKPEDADKLKNVPIWVWHGTEDTAVPFRRSVEMVDSIRAAGGTAIRFTTLEGIGHNSWESAYATPELYGWLDQHTVSKNHFRNPAVGLIQEGRSKFANLDGTRIHYVQAGQGSPTLLFVHGWSCHSGFWREQAPALADRATLLFVDLPGHGQSDKQQAEYSMDYFARAVLAVLKDAGAEKAVLLGHSMGVPVICRVHAQAPEKVAGLVTVDGSLRRPSLDAAQVDRFLARYRAQDYRDQVARFIGGMFPEAGTETLRDRVILDMSNTPQHVMVSAFAGMFDPKQPAWDLPKTSVPVLALQAPNPMWTAEYQEHVRTRSERADYRVLEKTGHFLMLEKPAEFNAALLGMLAKAGLISR